MKTDKIAIWVAHSRNAEALCGLNDELTPPANPTRSTRKFVEVVAEKAAEEGPEVAAAFAALFAKLALFIPRATADQSPFRFLVIDDPVQAMDPAKVDGLAQVLQGVARTRQVIVFTHDDRLPEAIRRLQIPAVVWEVVRKANSLVEIRKNSDPVQRYLDDARALANADDIAPEIRGPVIAGFLRSAIESAAQDKIRRTMLGSGDARAEVEARIEAADTTNKLLALALFGDAGKGGDVLPRLNQWRPDLATAFKNCREGVHGSHFNSWSRNDLMTEANRVQDLAQRINNA